MTRIVIELKQHLSTKQSIQIYTVHTQPSREFENRQISINSIPNEKLSTILTPLLKIHAHDKRTKYLYVDMKA